MLNPDYRDILSAFADASVEFLVVGAYAVAAHGVPRATGDRATPENAQRVWNALRAFGAPLDRVAITDFTREGNDLPGRHRAVGRPQDKADVQRLQSLQIRGEPQPE